MHLEKVDIDLGCEQQNCIPCVKYKNLVVDPSITLAGPHGAMIDLVASLQML